MKRPRESRRTLKRLPQDIRHQLEQLQVPPELLANPKVRSCVLSPLCVHARQAAASGVSCAAASVSACCDGAHAVVYA